MQGKEKEDTNLGVSDRDREAENGAVSQEPRKKMISRSRELLCLFFFFFLNNIATAQNSFGTLPLLEFSVFLDYLSAMAKSGSLKVNVTSYHRENVLGAKSSE